MKLVAIAVLVSSSAAYADYVPVYVPVYAPPPQVESKTPYIFGAAHVGAGTPLGVAGLEAGVAGENFRGAIGTGLGLRGTQLSAMGHATTDVLGPVVGLGLGISRGPALRITGEDEYGDGRSDENELHYAGETVWGSIELMVEYGFAAHGAVRVYAGVSNALAPVCETEEGGRCDPAQGAELEADGFIPYAGVALVLRSEPGRVNVPPSPQFPGWYP